MSENTVQIGFRGSREYRRKLQKLALSQGIKVQTLVQRAVDEYVAALEDESRPRARYTEAEKQLKAAAQLDPWHSMLSAILAGANREIREIVQMHLKIFSGLVAKEQQKTDTNSPADTTANK